MSVKEANPKDAVGVRKWRQFTTVPMTVISELGVAMLEGARKYGRHNYRVAGVRSSIYVDAAMGHLMQYWEGEDIDADSGLHHVVKAMASLAVLRDAMIQEKLTDDRPPKANLDRVRDELQTKVEEIMDRWPDALEPHTEGSLYKGGTQGEKAPPVLYIDRALVELRGSFVEEEVKRYADFYDVDPEDVRYAVVDFCPGWRKEDHTND
jgi:hypothetical protein